METNTVATKAPHTCPQCDSEIYKNYKFEATLTDGRTYTETVGGDEAADMQAYFENLYYSDRIESFTINGVQWKETN
jgi:hypothetical protein